ASSSSITLAGKRPLFSISYSACLFLLLPTNVFPVPVGLSLVGFVPVFRGRVLSLHPSIFRPPVPHFITFSATVFSLKGFLASTIGSWAGFKAVPHPSLSRASGDCGFDAVFFLNVVAIPVALAPVVRLEGSNFPST